MSKLRQMLTNMRGIEALILSVIMATTVTCLSAWIANLITMWSFQ